VKELTSHKITTVNEQITILADDDRPGPGGAPHFYEIRAGGALTQLRFQNGTLPEVGVNGITTEALLAVCADRLEAFQAGPFACPENEAALRFINSALYWLGERAKERKRRGVEGTYEK